MRGPYSTPITPLTGSLFHADPQRRLRDMLRLGHLLQPKKDLEFEVISHTVPKGFILYWKVLNRGPEAIKRDCVRGQIVADAGHLKKSESTNFKGDHIVECYAVLHGVVVAKSRIHVPIDGQTSETT